MNLSELNKSFCAFLEKRCSLAKQAPFALVCIRLALLVQDVLPHAASRVLGERQKQLRGEIFSDAGFDEMLLKCRDELDRSIGAKSHAAVRQRAAFRLIFCALQDLPEPDFFYLTEPIFESARELNIPASEVQEAIDAEFLGFPRWRVGR